MSETILNTPEFTVSELSQAVKRTIEDGFGYVRVRGEISGYRGQHSSGHAYFSLKDEGARIDAVVWRGSFGKLRFKPEEGMEVIAIGRLTTFPGKSSYQIVIESLEPAGVGALMALLEERKKKLAAEGLFDPARKRRLPYLPRVIGVVTSPTGAVIRDILHRISDRFPVHVVVWPVRVQGETSAREVTDGIRGFNALPEAGYRGIPKPDVIIVARGGGSLEDLWSFNEEIVVRAAAESAIPLVSAVGHETDWTLIDHAADLRAPTPTGAAEMVVPVKADLIDAVDRLGVRLSGAVRRGVERRRVELRSAARALPDLRNLLGVPRQRLDIAGNRLGQALVAAARLKGTALARVAGRLTPQTLVRALGIGRERLGRLAERRDRAIGVAIARRRDRLEGLAPLLRTLSYQSVLGRGFALVRDDEGRPIRSAAAIAAGARLGIEFADGRIAAIAGDAADLPPEPIASAPGPAPASDRPQAAPRPRKRATPPADQGSLF